MIVVCVRSRLSTDALFAVTVLRYRLRDHPVVAVTWPAAGAALIVAMGTAFRLPQSRQWIMSYAAVHPGDQVGHALVRLPLSMFAPASLLPFWFAVTQVAFVALVGYLLVGGGRTLLVAFAAHACATLSARWWIAIGPPIGLPERYRHFVDTGPSVAALAVLVAIALAYRLWPVLIIVVVYDIVELLVFNGLSQREHFVGVLVGVAFGMWFARHPTVIPSPAQRPPPPRDVVDVSGPR